MSLAFNLEKTTLENENFRQVLFSGRKMELVIMSVEKSIPWEKHDGIEQFIRIEGGRALAELEVEVEGKIKVVSYMLGEGDSVVVPAGVYHQITNVDSDYYPLKLYTIYSPPHHGSLVVEEYPEEKE